MAKGYGEKNKSHGNVLVYGDTEGWRHPNEDDQNRRQSPARSAHCAMESAVAPPLMLLPPRAIPHSFNRKNALLKWPGFCRKSVG